MKWPEVATFQNFTDMKYYRGGTIFMADSSKRTLVGPVYTERQGDEGNGVECPIGHAGAAQGTGVSFKFYLIDKRTSSHKRSG